MKVHELIEILQGLESEADVHCAWEEDGVTVTTTFVDAQSRGIRNKIFISAPPNRGNIKPEN